MQDFTNQEVALIYMFLGGIPYYLEQFTEQDNFIRSVNDTIFTSKSIFLDEYKEVLNLDFNSAGLETVTGLLSFFNFAGKTKLQLQKLTSLPESNTRYFLNNLLDYEIIFARKDSFTKKSSEYKKFYLKDFYLNFYF